ncbi:MAG: hypothetical protein IPJ31_07955 [Bacteroidetes bacterium]|nr:hypothetical protein [Bacteroidota bacterium]
MRPQLSILLSLLFLCGSSCVLYLGLQKLQPHSLELVLSLKAIESTNIGLECKHPGQAEDKIDTSFKLLPANQFFMPLKFRHFETSPYAAVNLHFAQAKNTLYFDQFTILHHHFSNSDTIYKWNCSQDLRKLLISTHGCKVADKNGSYLEFQTENENAFITLNLDKVLNAAYKRYHKIQNVSLILISILLSCFLLFIFSKAEHAKETCQLHFSWKPRSLLIPSVVAILGVTGLNSIWHIIPDLHIKENRAMSERPILNRNTLFTYTDELSKHVSEHFAFRNLFFFINSYFQSRVFNESALLDKVIMGNKGWFFYNDIGSINDYRRMSDLDSNLARYIVNNFLIRQNWLKERGIKFYILVPPNKERIYPDYMPKRIKIIDGLGHNTLDYLAKYLKELGGFTFIDPSDSLLAARRRKEVYYKTDTHWNTFGGFKGYQKLMHAIVKDFSDLRVFDENEFTLTEILNEEGDLSSMIGLNATNKRKEIMMKPVDTSLHLDYNIPTKMILKFSNTIPGSHPKRKLLMFRDSFGSYLVPFLNLQFDETVFVWNYIFMHHLIEQEKPDIVVFESLQRFVLFSMLVQNPTDLTTPTTHSNP